MFLLIFTIFTDFTSASADQELMGTCESQISCVDVDLHSSSDSQHHDSDDHNCHLGHSHNVILGGALLETKPKISIIYLSRPMHQVGKIFSYLSDINRPPIA